MNFYSQLLSPYTALYTMFENRVEYICSALRERAEVLRVWMAIKEKTKTKNQTTTKPWRGTLYKL